MKSGRWASAIATLLLLASVTAAAKKKHAAPAPKVAEASPQTARAISELAGKFKWGMSPDEAMKIVGDDVVARYQDRLHKESNAFKQDTIRKELDEQLGKIKSSYVKFGGQKTGWDVSIVDHEFTHRNDESMFVIWEKDQRRFLFFWDGKLWKQFIAFNAEHPAFAGKTFDDFADLIQKRYGPAAITFRKLRTSDEQTLDHLEWAPTGDYVLWAIDLTTFYGNYCLSLMQKSRMAEIERERKEHGPQRASGSGLVDAVMQPAQVKGDVNADIVDEITGRNAEGTTAAEPEAPASSGTSTHARRARDTVEKPKKPASADPLDGTSF